MLSFVINLCMIALDLFQRVALHSLFLLPHYRVYVFLFCFFDWCTESGHFVV